MRQIDKMDNNQIEVLKLKGMLPMNSPEQNRKDCIQTALAGWKPAVTPYQLIKQTGEKSWFHSPDGFVKIEEFEHGARYLHSPLIGYPVRMSNWK